MPTVVAFEPPLQPRRLGTCESCHRRPACITLIWPDTSFDVCPPCAPPPQPASAALQADAQYVLLAAARTLRTSRIATQGQRLSADGDCDVVAALTLAAGGAVEGSGHLTPPEEAETTRALNETFTQLADHLAQGTWPADPLLLIDAWQSGPGLTGQIAADTVRNAARSRTAG